MSDVRTTRLAATSGVAAMLTVLLLAGSARADLQPFASLSGTCDPARSSSSSASGAPVTGDHPYVVAQRRVQGGAATFTDPGGWFSQSLDAEDTAWTDWRELLANDTPREDDVWCPSDQGGATHYTTTFYDVPAAPATFAGRGKAESVLPFAVPGSGQYVVDLQLTNGAVALGGKPVASSGTYSLGTASAGVRTLSVYPLDELPASWSITIRRLPVAIRSLAWSSPETSPGAIVRASYNASGDTRITAAISDQAGNRVRTLATQAKVAAGDHTLTWDGRDEDGSPLALGEYTLTMISTDPGGLQSSANADIEIVGQRCGIGQARGTGRAAILARERSGFRERFPSRIWSADHHCWDLTGDGEPEMVVHLHCCTGGSPAPWGIFRLNSVGEWRLAYVRLTDTAWFVRRRGRQVRATQPWPYEGACTRFVRDRIVTWSGERFRARVTPRHRTRSSC